jgi:hypothetical protein
VADSSLVVRHLLNILRLGSRWPHSFVETSTGMGPPSRGPSPWMSPRPRRGSGSCEGSISGLAGRGTGLGAGFAWWEAASSSSSWRSSFAGRPVWVSACSQPRRSLRLKRRRKAIDPRPLRTVRAAGGGWQCRGDSGIILRPEAVRGFTAPVCPSIPSEHPPVAADPRFRCRPAQSCRHQRQARCPSGAARVLRLSWQARRSCDDPGRRRR